MDNDFLIHVHRAKARARSVLEVLGCKSVDKSQRRLIVCIPQKALQTLGTVQLWVIE